MSKRLKQTVKYTPHSWEYSSKSGTEKTRHKPEYIHFYNRKGVLRATFAVMELTEPKFAGIVLGVARANPSQTGSKDPPITKREGIRIAETRLRNLLEVEMAGTKQDFSGNSCYMGPKGRSFFFSYKFIADFLGIEFAKPLRRHKSLSDYAYLLTRFIQTVLEMGREEDSLREDFTEIDRGYYREFLDLKTWQIKLPALSMFYTPQSVVGVLKHGQVKIPDDYSTLSPLSTKTRATEQAADEAGETSDESVEILDHYLDQIEISKAMNTVKQSKANMEQELGVTVTTTSEDPDDDAPVRVDGEGNVLPTENT
jgi:hypothetical protein